MPPTAQNRAGPVDQPKGVTREPIEFARIALTNGTLQCRNRSAPEISRVFCFAFRLKVRHATPITMIVPTDKHLHRPLLASRCGFVFRFLRSCRGRTVSRAL